MKSNTVLITALIALTALAPVRAQEPAEPVAGATEAAGEDSSDGSPERLTRELAWHTDLRTALAQAQTENRLVFWVQMKGRIDGST